MYICIPLAVVVRELLQRDVLMTKKAVITIKIKTDGQDEVPSTGGFSERIMEMQRRIFQNLFEGLHCEHEEHRDFENVITASIKDQPLFQIEKICCKDFEDAIKKAVM